ncbi:MAG: A/G-specific adenine glycosylase [Dactylosporangium sp.]|nr:A/G-specific adenine glycosylase [Dactylosporangium sp.]NNJ63007.1 A/G-specific adenine glycosylase [Dactylosporangium sp.]
MITCSYHRVVTKLSIAAAAVDWYSIGARDLPWRRPGVSPWGVLVSEIMLQQTQVSRVEPVWTAWCSRWPTPASLAAEPVGEAIRAWGRLGYPRRAVRLHSCATASVQRHGGRVPESLTELLALPGVGTYTARAVAVFAFRQRHPVVDTNVRRVVARAVTGSPAAGPATTGADLAGVEQLLPADPESAAATSIALMELGALLCTARAPRCPECPLSGSCAWRLAGSPAPTPAAATPDAPAANARGQRRSQRYLGTDRQVRGLLLAVLREATDPVPTARLDLVWPDAEQRARTLASLVADGLAHQVGTGHYALPA